MSDWNNWEELVLEMQTMKCPKCNLDAKVTKTKYGPRADCNSCKLTGWRGSDLVDEETRKLRIKSHNIFDNIWKEGGIIYNILKNMVCYESKIAFNVLARVVGYNYLAKLLNMKENEVHRQHMNKEVAIKVIDISEKIINNDLIINNNTIEEILLLINKDKIHIYNQYSIVITNNKYYLLCDESHEVTY